MENVVRDAYNTNMMNMPLCHKANTKVGYDLQALHYPITPPHTHPNLQGQEVGFSL